jgi:hypothetical protein
VRLASRGLRDMDDGAAPITDAAVLSAVRAQARRVQRLSLLATAALTALYLIFT